MKHALLPIAVLVVLVGCSRAPLPIVDNREADARSLRAAEEAAIKAFVSKDGDKMVSAYSADADLMLSNSPVLKGEDLRAAIKAMVADPNFSMQFRTDKVEAAKSGELGYTRGAAGRPVVAGKSSKTSAMPMDSQAPRKCPSRLFQIRLLAAEALLTCQAQCGLSA